MSANPVTDQIVAYTRDWVARLPADGREKAMVDGVAVLACQAMPETDPAAVGEAMMQISRVVDAIVKRVREQDPALGWESIHSIALNFLTVAGAQLYTDGAS